MNNTHKLYHPLILEHGKRPRCFYPMDGAARIVEAYNPICGDQFQIFFKEPELQSVSEVSFQGYGCAVSIAASSMILERIQGLSVADAQRVIGSFLQLLDKDEDISIDDEPLSVFCAVRENPGRRDCAILSARAILTYLENLKE